MGTRRPSPHSRPRPAPVTPNGNADGESQTIIEGGGEEGDTPDADGAAGDDVVQVIADVAQGIAYEQDGRPDAPRPDAAAGDAVTQTPPPPAAVVLVIEPGGNTEPTAGPFTPSVPATAQPRPRRPYPCRT